MPLPVARILGAKTLASTEVEASVVSGNALVFFLQAINVPLIKISAVKAV
jgi:hypothetical protein